MKQLHFLCVLYMLLPDDLICTKIFNTEPNISLNIPKTLRFFGFDSNEAISPKGNAIHEPS